MCRDPREKPRLPALPGVGPPQGRKRGGISGRRRSEERIYFQQAQPSSGRRLYLAGASRADELWG